MRGFNEKQSEKQTFQFKICLYCSHIQRVEYGVCDKCGAGKIGLGKPSSLWAYIDLKVEVRMTLPTPMLIEDIQKADQERESVLNASAKQKQL